MIKELAKLGTQTGPQLHSSALCPHGYFFLLVHVCITVRSAKSVWKAHSALSKETLAPGHTAGLAGKGKHEFSWKAAVDP